MSKFDKLFEARDEAVKEKPAATGKNTGGKASPSKNKKQGPVPTQQAPDSTPDAVESHSNAVASPTNKQRGRPKAKRSNPDFIGFTTYIRKDTHLNVKILLLQEGNGREMSELVEELLSGWIKNK